MEWEFLHKKHLCSADSFTDSKIIREFPIFHYWRYASQNSVYQHSGGQNVREFPFKRVIIREQQLFGSNFIEWTPLAFMHFFCIFVILLVLMCY